MATGDDFYAFMRIDLDHQLLSHVRATAETQLA